MTEEQKAKSDDKLSQRLAKLFLDESSWERVPGHLAVELKGDSQCVIRWLEGLYYTGNIGYAAKVAKMQNLLCDLSVSCLLRLPEYGRNIFKWVYREGNTEADEMTWNARTGNCGIWHDDDFLELIKLNTVLINCIRGSFHG
eukprot:6999105-Pyramimonas_sp.AAC.1